MLTTQGGGERWATEDRATQIRPLVKMDQFGFGFGQLAGQLSVLPARAMIKIKIPQWKKDPEEVVRMAMQQNTEID